MTDGVTAPTFEHGELVKWRRRDYRGDFRAYLVDELGRSVRTADAYGDGLRRLARFSGKEPWEITVAELRSFIREAPYSRSTVSGAVVAMRAFHRWGALEGYWRLNGIGSVRTPRAIADSPLALVPIPVVRALLSSCRTSYEYRVTYLGLYAGLRIAESASVDSRNWRKGLLTIVGKGSKVRQIPVHPELEKVRLKILERKPPHPGCLDMGLRRLRERLEARDDQGDPVRSHTLRKTFSTTLREAGVPYDVCKTLLGHSLGVTESYIRLPLEPMKDAIEALNYDTGEPIQLSFFERAPALLAPLLTGALALGEAFG